MNKHSKIQAFTLVELIVVITILAILATVAFISFQWYTQNSRDWVRLADLWSIQRSFEYHKTKGWIFPLPDNKVDISAWAQVVQYQWVFSKNILAEVWVHNGWKDPLTGDYYWYVVNQARNKFQIIGFLESQDNIALNSAMPNTFANNSEKFLVTAGNKLWVLLDENSHEIIQDTNQTLNIDITAPASNYAIVIWDEIVTWGQQETQKLVWSGYSTCLELYNSVTNIASWEYYLDGIWNVYCDMDSHGWWWTAIGKYKDWSPSDDIDFRIVGNNIVSQSTQFLALIEYNNGTQTGAFLSDIKYDGKQQWYIQNHQYFGVIWDHYNQNNDVKLWYGVRNLQKYKNYWALYSMLYFKKWGMVFRFTELWDHHAVFESQSGCISSSYVSETNYPFGPRAAIQLNDETCSASYNDTKIWLLFR